MFMFGGSFIPVTTEALFLGYHPRDRLPVLSAHFFHHLLANALKLVSHWHANLSRLFREFSRGTFARHSCECRENFYVSRTSRERIAKVLNMFKNWMRIFFPKYFARLSCDGRMRFVRMSRTCRREILANLQCEIFATLVRMSCECRTTVVRHS